MGSFLSSLVGGSDPDGGPDSKGVLKFSTSAEWHDFFNESRDSSTLVVSDFFATWCGPCKLIKPAFNAMAEKFSAARFVQLDVHKIPDVAKEFKVEGMPTFVLLKRGEEKARVVGAKKDELERKIQQHYAIPAAQGMYKRTNANAINDGRESSLNRFPAAALVKNRQTLTGGGSVSHPL